MERGLRYLAAALVLAGGIVHFVLWLDLYRDVPDSVIGPAFLLNVIASVVVAVALAVSDHVLVLVAGLLVVDGTLLAFALSRTGLGFLGFEERGFEPSPEAALTLVFEIAAAVVLLWLLWRRLTDEDRASVVVA